MSWPRTAGQPDDLLDAQGLLEFRLDPVPALAGVAVVVDDRALGDEEGALAIGLEGAALGDQWGLAAGDVVRGQEGAAHPGVVGVLLLVAPAVEVEVDAGDLAVVLHEHGHRVAGPQVVDGERNDLDVAAARLLGGLLLVGPGQHHDVLVLRDGVGDAGDVLAHVTEILTPHRLQGGPRHEGACVALPLGAHSPSLRHRVLVAGAARPGRRLAGAAGRGAQDRGTDPGDRAEGRTAGGEMVGHGELR